MGAGSFAGGRPSLAHPYATMGICDLLRHEEEAKKENKIAKARKIWKCSSFTPVSLKVPQQEPATASKWAMKLTKARAMRVISIHFMAWPLEDERGEAGQVALDRKGCFVNACKCCHMLSFDWWLQTAAAGSFNQLSSSCVQ